MLCDTGNQLLPPGLHGIFYNLPELIRQRYVFFSTNAFRAPLKTGVATSLQSEWHTVGHSYVDNAVKTDI